MLSPSVWFGEVVVCCVGFPIRPATLLSPCRPNAQGLGPIGFTSTRVREVGESPSSLMKRCISFIYVMAIPSKGFACTVPLGSLRRAGASYSFFSGSTQRP